MNCRKGVYRYLLVLWCVCGSVACHAQDYLFSLEHFGLENGLPARSLYFVAQDQQGFIWLSSQLGIHRFDGNRFKTYYNKQLGLPSRHVARLAVDRYDRLWIWARAGKYPDYFCRILDPGTDSVFSIEQVLGERFQRKALVAMSELPGGQPGICFVMDDGTLYRFDEKIREVGRFQLSFRESVLRFRLVNTRPGTYYLVEARQIHVLREGQPGYRFPVRYPPDASNVKSCRAVDQELLLSVGNRHMQQTYRVKDSTLLPCTLPGHPLDSTIHILYKSPQYYIYSTYDSLHVCDLNGTPLAEFATFEAHPLISGNRVQQVLPDQQGNIWLPSVEGLYKLSIRKNPFEVRFPGKSIYGMLLEGSKLWTTGGVDTLWRDFDNGEYALRPFQATIRAVTEDHAGRKWVTNHGKYLFQYDSAGRSFVRFNIPLRDAPSLFFQNPETGRMWLGTHNGLYDIRFSPTDTVLQPIIPRVPQKRIKIKHFHQNTEGIWVASGEGLWLIDAKTSRQIRHVGMADGMPGENLQHIHEDSAGNFWLATRGSGLIYWNRQADTFEQFTTENGLSNNTLYAVYEDQQGTLWLPSDYGLMAFDPKNRDVRRVYHKEDGIAHDEFNTFSHLRDADGRFYFGGLGGVTIFHPDSLSPSAKAPARPILLTQARVLAADATEYEDRTHLVRKTGKIELAPSDQVVDLEFSFLDFALTARNQIAYRLTGYQENWVYPGDMRIILMNLPYGEFELQVRARGASGRWTRHFLSVPLVVLRPFYLRAWFLLLMLVLLTAAVVIGIRWRTRALRRDRLRLAREVRNRTATIAAQAEELKALDRAKSRFFANITHEIRTPLTLVIGPGEQLLEEKDLSRIRRGLRGMLTNARSLLQLINQLLDISKLEHASMRVEARRGDIMDFTRALVGQFDALAERKALQLDFHCSPHVWETALDFGKWEKIVRNLLSNALKYSPAGGQVQVRLDRATIGDVPCLRLQVRDSGQGIPPRELDRIFDRFYQVAGNGADHPGGTGIGLALVKELVELQEGTVEVESRVGEGTAFTVRLPIMSDGDKQESEAQPADDAPDTRLKLLLIEDNAALRRFVRSCIDAQRYDVIEAADGEAGIRKAFEIVPDLIISDVMMPKRDGFEVLQAIRTHVATSHVPCILLTARASLESKLEGLRRGADAYLTKPFSPEELRIRIRKLLELRGLMQERYRPAMTLQELAVPRKELPEELKSEAHFMADLVAFIEANMDNPDLKVQMIAGHFGVSRPQLYRKLSAITDVGVAELIRSARCERALELIKAGEMRMSEIAYAIGYSSPAHFSRSFKQQFGLSPTEVMKSETRTS